MLAYSLLCGRGEDRKKEQGCENYLTGTGLVNRFRRKREFDLHIKMKYFSITISKVRLRRDCFFHEGPFEGREGKKAQYENASNFVILLS